MGEEWFGQKEKEESLVKLCATEKVTEGEKTATGTHSEEQDELN